MQLKYTLFSSISMLAFSSLSVFSQTEKMNVLFLMADDMRPELGCYGVKEVKTPNIDRFAASGLLFQNAYCNIPVSWSFTRQLINRSVSTLSRSFCQLFRLCQQRLPDRNSDIKMVYITWLLHNLKRQGFPPSFRSC